MDSYNIECKLLFFMKGDVFVIVDFKVISI